MQPKMRFLSGRLPTALVFPSTWCDALPHAPVAQNVLDNDVIIRAQLPPQLIIQFLAKPSNIIHINSKGTLIRESFGCN